MRALVPRGGGRRAADQLAPSNPPTSSGLSSPSCSRAGYVDGAAAYIGTASCAWPRPDELVPLHDDRVRENPAYLTVVLLARVVTRLGTYHRRPCRAHREHVRH